MAKRADTCPKLTKWAKFCPFFVIGKIAPGRLCGYFVKNGQYYAQNTVIWCCFKMNMQKERFRQGKSLVITNVIYVLFILNLFLLAVYKARQDNFLRTVAIVV